MLTTMLAAALLSGRAFNFYPDGPYDASVPKPESILGYGPGERHTTYRDQEVVFNKLTAGSNRVKMFPYGKTTEGRPLRIYAISSPSNIANLEKIRLQHADLAQGKGDPSATVPIVWINQCIHGDETASFETAMWTAYNLIASRGDMAKTLEKAVVILNPVYNPDGHERYVVYYNSVSNGSFEPGAFELGQPSAALGRANHFRFDMNRDRVAFSQDETRAEFAEMLRWGPQVYIDQHGQVSTYFFPPEPMSVNPNVDRNRNAKWTDVLGRATAKDFDSLGLSYYTKDVFDFYYPGYLDISSSLSGAIGMTHETDGGRTIVSKRPDGSLLTLTQGVYKHFISARAVVKATAANAKGFLADYAKFKKDATTGESAGKFKRVVVTSPDTRPLLRLQSQLSYAGIKAYFAKSAFEATDAHGYWDNSFGKVRFEAKSLIVDIAQPQGAMAKALLEPSTPFEEEFIKAQVGKKAAAPEGETYPGPENGEFYDFTGWSLPYAHGLQAWWCESAPKVETTNLVGVYTDGVPGASSPIGYALRYSDQEDILAVYEALAADVRGKVTNKPMKLGEVTYPAGTFLFMAEPNDDKYADTLAKIGKSRHVSFEPLMSAYPEEGRNSPGAESVSTLRKPKIGIVMGTGGNMAQSGFIWYLFERVFKIPFVPMSGNALNGDLSSYTAIIFPSGATGSTSGKLRDWISAGNVAVAFDSIGWALGSSGFVDLATAKGEPQSLPGSLFRAELDPRSFLSYGYPVPAKGKIELAVPIAGDKFYTVRKEGGSVISLSNDEKATKLLSGWAWPNDTEKNLRNTVFLQDAPVGRGHAILYTQDPTERTMWPGLYKTLLNALILGSSQ